MGLPKYWPGVLQALPVLFCKHRNNQVFISRLFYKVLQ